MDNKDIAKIVASVIIAPIAIGAVLNLANFAVRGTYKVIQNHKIKKQLKEELNEELNEVEQ